MLDRQVQLPTLCCAEKGLHGCRSPIFGLVSFCRPFLVSICLDLFDLCARFLHALQPPWLEFGRLRLGQKKSLQLEIQNITDEIQVLFYTTMPKRLLSALPQTQI